jgi:hypothetical protein
MIATPSKWQDNSVDIFPKRNRNILAKELGTATVGNPEYSSAKLMSRASVWHTTGGAEHKQKWWWESEVTTGGTSISNYFLRQQLDSGTITDVFDINTGGSWIVDDNYAFSIQSGIINVGAGDTAFQINPNKTSTGSAVAFTVNNTSALGVGDMLLKLSNNGGDNFRVGYDGMIYIAGTQIDTNDLLEGTNLFFTDERAQDAVGTILTDGTTINFTYTDATPAITAEVTPSGADGNVQYNNGGVLGADADHTWDDTTDTLTLGKIANWKNLTIADSYTPTERIVDGNFANWGTIYQYPDADIYLSSPDGNGLNPTKFNRSTDKHGGTYAMQLECYSDFGGGTYISSLVDVFDPFTNSDTVSVSVWQKNLSGTTAFTVGYYYIDGADDIHWYNFTGANAGTWPVGTENPTSDELYSAASGATYAQATSTQATAPASGVVSSGIVIVASGTNAGTVVFDDLEVLINSSNIMTNGGFENWTGFPDQTTPLTSWTFVDGAGWKLDFSDATVHSYITREASSVQAGTYAVRMHVGSYRTGSDNRGYIWQSYAGDADTALTASVYTKTTNSKTPYMILLDGNPGAHTQIWDFVANTWDTLGTTVTDLPGTSNALTLSGTGSYVQSSEATTIPASGNIVMVLMSDDGAGGANEYYFDTASFIEQVLNPGTFPTLFDMTNPSDYADVITNQVLLQLKTTGSTDRDILKMVKNASGNIAVTTYVGGFDFSAQNLFCATPDADTEVANKAYADARETAANTYTDGEIQTSDHLLATVTGIDMKPATTTDIFTGTTGKSTYITRVVIKPTTITNYTVAGSCTIGANASNYNDIIDGISVSVSTTASHINAVPATNGIVRTVAPTEVVKLSRGKGVTADVYTVTAYVYGYQITN